MEFNELNSHPVQEQIPEALQSPYFGPQHTRGQFPMRPPLEEAGLRDVQTQFQALWIYFCAILQFWEDEAAISEGILFRGKTQRPNALVLYIMDLVNLQHLSQ